MIKWFSNLRVRVFRRQTLHVVCLLPLSIRHENGIPPIDLVKLTGLALGTVHTVLDFLEKYELVVGTWDERPYPRLRRYALTNDGTKFKKSLIEQLLEE